MIAAFTGTRRGMSMRQTSVVSQILDELDPEALHHGCCVGADNEANDLAGFLQIPTHGHPAYGFDHPLRSHCYLYKCALPNGDPIARNHDIVDAADHLVAASGSDQEVLRSGTWATIRYAVRVGKPVTIIYPCGRTELR